MNKIDLGDFTLCLKVENLAESIRFYQKLGFQVIDDQSQDKWAVLQHNNLILSLYQGHIERNLLNFRGGDINDIAEKAVLNGIAFSQSPVREEDGSWSAEAKDPDGNTIYFNTFPSERELYLKKGTVFDE